MKNRVYGEYNENGILILSNDLKITYISIYYIVLYINKCDRYYFDCYKKNILNLHICIKYFDTKEYSKKY